MKKSPPFGSCSFLMLSTSPPSYLWGDVILTATHLINHMPSCVHFQTPLDYLKESYPSTCSSLIFPFGCLDAQPVLTKLNSLLGLRLVCLFGILCTNEAINASTHLHESTSLPWMTPLLKIVLSLPLAYFSGRVSQESNYMLPLESTCPIMITLPDSSLHTTVQPTNQVPCKTPL
ncbi:Retrovirus-related Pol polyprotein from transposon TNT 1-94 [Cucumis melo var. makuwa]|uniref:Retrovirus-related Pol polyprotein from transposon TNT 1-94 n=1 Tax=Cucumis melo var. makuwa TaxID=1194695 RepID=A0A5D3BXF8_CUCMM|nr:Retrovirus-related Pol polyprotein from transposon TNT 1-94 [Cucumis melo var. makuwa]